MALSRMAIGFRATSSRQSRVRGSYKNQRARLRRRQERRDPENAETRTRSFYWID